MEPLGTITYHFPFLDDETRNVLEETMRNSSDYYEFTQKLGAKAQERSVSEFVVYLAIYHAALAMDYGTIDKLREKYQHSLLLDPQLYFYSAYQGKTDDLEKVHESADAYLATNPPDWLLLEMSIIKFEASMRNYPQTIYDQNAFDGIINLINSDSRFGFYKSTMNDYLEGRAYIDGNTEERISCFDRAIEVSEKYDDRVRLCDFLIKKAHIIKDYNRVHARELLQQALQLSEIIGIPADYAEIISTLATLDAIQGEFNNSIKHFMRALTIRERAGLNTANISYFLSLIYNVIGEPESGYEWGCMAEDQFKSRPHLIPRAILNQAWSLLLLDKKTEALMLIETIRSTIMKSGNENHLAWLHFVTGVMEMLDGDTVSSASSISEALKIYENQGGAELTQLIFLFYLARNEVLSSDQTSLIPPSLAIMEEKALNENLPGFLGLVLLLKADIANITNDDSTLREIIRELEPLTENEGSVFLKPLFEKLLNRI